MRGYLGLHPFLVLEVKNSEVLVFPWAHYTPQTDSEKISPLGGLHYRCEPNRFLVRGTCANSRLLETVKTFLY